MTTLKQIQRALVAAGGDLGPTGADGVWGRRSITAAKAYQQAHGLTADGQPSAALIRALGLVPGSGAAAVVPWLELARTKKGLIETNPAAKEFLKADGHTLGDPAKLPWCGDFVETCIALTLPKETMVANPYYALNWLKFGVSLSEPALGAILAFQRPGGGHVAFYLGEKDDNYYVLGGNQSNSVSQVFIAKERCKGIRWPATFAKPTSGRILVSASGSVSTNEA